AERDVLPAFDRDLADPPIDPRRDVEPGRIHLALHQQGFGPHEVPNREACDGGYDEADDDRRSTCRPGPRVRCWFFRRQRLALRCSARRRLAQWKFSALLNAVGPGCPRDSRPITLSI